MNTRTYGIGIATRAQRRRLVVLMYGFYLTTFLMTLPVLSQVKLLAIPLAVGCVVPYVVILRFTRAYTLRSSAFYEPPRPDERQARVRDHAMAQAYLVLGTLTMVAGALIFTVADEPDWWRVHHRTVQFLVVLGVNFLVLSLPEAIIAWNEPDTLT